MFHNEVINTILIIIILITKHIQILGIDLQFNGNLIAFKNNFKFFQKQSTNRKDKLYQVNKNVLGGNEYGRIQKPFNNQMPTFYKRQNSNKYSEEQHNQHTSSYQNLDYGDQRYYKMPNFIPPKITYYSGQMYRREVASNGVLKNSSLYPSVLAKALEISLNPSASTNLGESLFSNVAQKMNTSTLDLAAEIAKSETSKNEKMVQNYIKTNPLSSTSNLALSPTSVQNVIENLQSNLGLETESDDRFDGISTSSLAAILDRVLNKLDSIKNSKSTDDKEHPDGAPCDVIGTWSSTTLGFCFDIQLLKDKFRNTSPAERNNNILSISVSECIPAKHHQIIDLDWKFTGSAIKQWGGPFYAYGQKRNDNVVATFLGFCRTCGDIDTIFGSWNFLLPSKDCLDISLANEVKRDILRRVRMEIKRKERYKDLLYQNRHRNM